MTFAPQCSCNLCCCNEGGSIPVGAFTDPCAVAMARFSELAGQEDRDKHSCEPMDEK